jgi:nucleotide-binding universal stress UspA family protein
VNARIVVGIDGSEESRRALDWACREAQLRHADLEVVHAHSASWEYGAVPMAVVPIQEIEASHRKLMKDEVAEARRHNTGIRIEQFLVNDMPAHALVEQAKGAELLVVGSRGRGGFTGLLLGSVSQHVSHHAPCPVVIVPAK